VSAFGFAASRLSQGDQRGHDTGGFNPRDGAAYRSERPLKADLGRAKTAREDLAKKPAIRGGRKSREVTAVRRHHNGKPIRVLDAVLHLTQWQAKWRGPVGARFQRMGRGRRHINRNSRSGVHRAAHFRNCRLSAGSIAEFRRGYEGARWLRCL
jgi:hypothetical protein